MHTYLVKYTDWTGQKMGMVKSRKKKGKKKCAHILFFSTILAVYIMVYALTSSPAQSGDL